MTETKYKTETPGLHVERLAVKFRPWAIIHTTSGAVVVSVKRLRQAREVSRQIADWADWSKSPDYLMSLNIARRVRTLAAEVESASLPSDKSGQAKGGA